MAHAETLMGRRSLLFGESRSFLGEQRLVVRVRLTVRFVAPGGLVELAARPGG